MAYDLERLQNIGCRMIDLCIKFERNHIIRTKIIDFANFRRVTSRGYHDVRLIELKHLI